MRYNVDADRVSHERLQDEVIIINAATGCYFSGSGTAADLWTLISEGMSFEDIVTTLAHAYGTESATISRDVEICVAQLIGNDVITASEDAPSVRDVGLPALERLAWSAPAFDEYSDMWDLLQADPIHDVTETGWPYAQPRPIL